MFCISLLLLSLFIFFGFSINLCILKGYQMLGQHRDNMQKPCAVLSSVFYSVVFCVHICVRILFFTRSQLARETQLFFLPRLFCIFSLSLSLGVCCKKFKEQMRPSTWIASLTLKWPPPLTLRLLQRPCVRALLLALSVDKCSDQERILFCSNALSNKKPT